MEMKCSNCGEVYYDGHVCKRRIDSGLPITDVKEPKKSIGGFTIDVDSTGIDEALDKSRALLYVLGEIDKLQKQIIKGAERVEQIANRCCRVKEDADHEVEVRPKESYAEWSRNQAK